MDIPVVELSKFKKTQFNELRGTQPYCIAFVYAKEGNWVVKGMSEEVETYIAQRFPYSFYRYTYWHNGKSRGNWRTPRNLRLYFTRVEIRNRIRYVVSMETKSGYQEGILTFRNMPKKWLPVFDNAIFKEKINVR